MDTYVIETTGLTKRYGDIAAVDHLDLKVRRGEVYGFLGANGAGKTTTLRMLLGLIRPTEGTASVLGGDPGSEASLFRIGSMIETPAFYPHLSGRDNLWVLAKYSGTPQDRIDVVLAQVDLAGRGGDAFGTYSLGMKQRLGVAAALMKEPDLLILDEPTNGLDPAGMAEMRTLIRELGSGDRTVVVSSHLMTEVEQVCDRAGIIADGRMVAEGTIDELRGEDALMIQADPLDEARTMISAFAGVREVVVIGQELRVTACEPGGVDPARINAHLVREGIEVRELRMERASLESVFLALTSGATHGDAPAQVAAPSALQPALRNREVTHV
jgi:ABC-type multidrug transport system ATPase subunit